MNNVTCTLQQAKHLKALGWDKETELCYFKGKTIAYRSMEFATPEEWQSVIFMPTAQEVIDEMPDQMGDDYLVMEKFDKAYRVSYFGDESDFKNSYCTDSNLAVALTDKYILLREKGLVGRTKAIPECGCVSMCYLGRLSLALLVSAISIFIFAASTVLIINYDSHTELYDLGKSYIEGIGQEENL